MATLAASPMFVQGIGLVAFTVMVSSFQSNVRQRILYIQILAMALLGVHMFLLGALTGAAMMMVLLVRNFVFAQKARYAWASHPRVFWIMLGLVFLVGILAWDGISSLFAIGGSFLATYGFWLNEPRRIRQVTLASAFVWLPYSIIIMSYPMLLLQAFLMSSLLIAMWRYDRKGALVEAVGSVPDQSKNPV